MGETQLAWIMAVVGRAHSAYMMGIVASLYSFGVDKKTRYYDESLRLKTELDLVLRSRTKAEREKHLANIRTIEGKLKAEQQMELDGLTPFDRMNIEKYADLGWNLSEGIHMSSPEVFRVTPFSVNATEKVELYRVFLLKILRLAQYEEVVQSLLRQDFTVFKNRSEVRRALMRVMCFLVREQFLLTGTKLNQNPQNLIFYSMVKKGELVDKTKNEPTEELLMASKYEVTSTCLLLVINKKDLDENIQDYLERANGDMGNSISSTDTLEGQLVDPDEQKEEDEEIKEETSSAQKPYETLRESSSENKEGEAGAAGDGTTIGDSTVQVETTNASTPRSPQTSPTAKASTSDVASGSRSVAIDIEPQPQRQGEPSGDPQSGNNQAIKKRRRRTAARPRETDPTGEYAGDSSPEPAARREPPVHRGPGYGGGTNPLAPGRRKKRRARPVNQDNVNQAGD